MISCPSFNKLESRLPAHLNKQGSPWQCPAIRRTWKEPDIRQNTEFDIPSETGNQKGWKSGPSLNIFMVGYLNA